MQFSLFSIFTVTLFSLSLWPAFSQQGKAKLPPKEKDEITWQAARKLVWNDFKGKAGANETKYALTTSDINVGINCDGSKFSYQVSAVFVPSQSWTRSLDSDALLAHEQLHFDITELNARKMRLTLSMLPKACLLEQKDIQKLIDRAFQDWHQMEEDYDKATNHGLNKQAQQEWQTAIARALAELEKVQ